MPSSLFSAPPSTPGLAAFTYQGRSAPSRSARTGIGAAGTTASTSTVHPITPRRAVAAPQLYHDPTVRPAAAGAASPSHGSAAWTPPPPPHTHLDFASYRRPSPYASPPILRTNGRDDDERGAVLAPAPHGPSSVMRQHLHHHDDQRSQHSYRSAGGADGALGFSPKPRTPSPRQQPPPQYYSTLPHADLRYPSSATFSPPPPAPYGIATTLGQPSAAGAAPCWMCEAWCSGGPGSAWVAAPALFFAPAPEDGQPVSSLTLCSVCAAAVSGGDPTATSREVLERCHRTPVIRYRTAAYVNAVREYAMLLRLMAEQVLRSSARLQSIQSAVMRQRSWSRPAPPQHVYADAHRDGDDEMGGEAAAHAPLSMMPRALQAKVLGQLVEALEDILARDQRAVRLAASGAAPQDPASVTAPSPSEVMASRERHFLLDELARVERQLGRLRAPVASTGGGAQARHAAPPSSVRPDARSVPAADDGDDDDDDGGVVRSPRPLARPSMPGASPARSPARRHTSADAALLAAAADPRTFHNARHRHGTTTTAAADASPGPSREASPPALTSSPQRGRPHVAAAVPFPLAAASPRRGAGRADDSADAPPSPPSHPVAAHERRRGTRPTAATEAAGYADGSASEAEVVGGRRVLRSLVDSAMWAAYRGGTAARSTCAALDGEGGAAAAGGERTAHVEGGGGAGWQLLDYFAGRLPEAPPLRVGGSAPHSSSTSTTAAAAVATAAAAPTRRTPPRTPAAPDATGHPTHAPRDAPPVSPRDAAAASTTTTTPMRDPSAGASAALKVVTSPSPAELVDLYGSDASVLRRRLHHERLLRREAEEAVLATQGRVAALEATTDQMAAALLTHRLAVTFRGHLGGMEMLVARWTRLAQNFCLQKSLLFAEEAALLVRQLQRASCGVAPLWAPTRWTPPPRRGATAALGDAAAVATTMGSARGGRRSTSPYVEARLGAAARRDAQGATEDGELWVSRGSDDGEERAATVRTSSTPRRQPPPSSTPSPLRPDAPATARFPFPAELKLRPLSLRV